MEPIHISQDVAILVDGNNMEKSVQGVFKIKNGMINFDTLVPRILQNRGLNRMVYFREGKNISSKLAERLYDNYYGSVQP